MIINLKKYLLVGAETDLDRFFAKAQEEGFIEFISLGKKTASTDDNITDILHALKILRRLPVKKRYLGGGDQDHALEVARKINFLDKEIEKEREETRLLRAEIARVSPFGDFDRQEIEHVEKYGKKKIQFFAVKTAKRHEITLPDEVLYIATEYDLDYYIAINSQATSYPDMIEMRIDRPLGELETQLQAVNDSIHKMDHELKEFAGHIHFLQEILVELVNAFHLEKAKQDTVHPMEEIPVFMIEAWVPENKVSSLFALTQEMSIEAEEILIEETDKIPTYMENKGISRMGEDLVKIYDIPAVTDKDPSPFIFWAFVLFFAMIVNDAGYGFLYLLVALFFKWKYPNLQAGKKRLLNLFLILSSACIVWGVLAASYFGIDVSTHSFWGEISVVKHLVSLKVQGTATPEQITEYSRDVFLELSLIVGIVHISISLLRYVKRNWSGIGWIVFLVGGYFFFPAVLGATPLIHFAHAKEVGLQLIYGGIGIAVLLLLIQKRLKGLAEIPNLIQVFADVLSYLRIYALGLAGAIMAETFNHIGEYIGLAAGVLATIIGHTVNIVLGMMSGVIHGLRLNFLEWYHYCFDGNGKIFNPLRKKPSE